MRKFLLTFFASFVLFFALSAFLSPIDIEAISFSPSGLKATPVCIGSGDGQSAIEFDWLTPQDYNKFNWRLWYTGLSSFKDVSGAEVDKPYIENVTQNTSISWYVEVCDKDFSFNQCSKQNGTTVTSKKCPPDGSEPPPPPPPASIDCENRDPRCPKNEYSECREFSSAPWSCPSPHCQFGSFDFPLFCAYKNNEPKPEDPCIKEGQTCLTDVCCSGLICDKPGSDKEGVCKKAPEDLGEECFKCRSGSSWSITNKRCEDSSGNKVQEESKGFCAEKNNLTCVQGEGCKAKAIITNAPLSSPCGNPSKRFGCSNIRTALGSINTKSGNFVTYALGLVLSISGGILLLLLIINGYKLMTSQGDPEKVKEGRDGIIAAIAGLLLIIFSLVILQLITINILGIPGFR